jgi:hypothetical protein
LFSTAMAAVVVAKIASGKANCASFMEVLLS